MSSLSNKSERNDADQLEQYDYARKRIKQKKRLMQHFIVFLVGALFLIILNPVLGYGKDFFIKDWFIWAILLWAFLLLIHVFNVFMMDKFMGKEWENKQLEILKSRQQARIDELKKQAIKEVTEAEVKAAKEVAALNKYTTEESDVKKNENPNQLPQENL